MKSYKQSTYETCLAVCFMNLLEIIPTRKKEIEIWKHGWNFNFLSGQLNYIAKKYKKNLSLIIDNKYYAKKLSEELLKNIHLSSQNVTVPFLENLVNENFVILYMDNFYLQRIVHYPHFVLITGQTGGNFIITDSWDGTIKMIDKKIVKKSILSLKKNLGFSPLVITEQKNTP